MANKFTSPASEPRETTSGSYHFLTETKGPSLRLSGREVGLDHMDLPQMESMSISPGKNPSVISGQRTWYRLRAVSFGRALFGIGLTNSSLTPTFGKAA